jgi:UDP-N-acetylmuramoyl-L-alanyl-D-glutamate--2,6-diaminopimelate ligase
MENYYQAKKRLFTHYLAPGGTAVINADDPWGERLCRELEGKVKILSFSSEGKGNCRIGSCRLDSSGVKFDLVHPEHGTLDISSNLAGAYNIRNLTGAVLAALEKGIAPSQIETLLKSPVRVPGRLESFALPGGGTVYVDYAHTDDALVNVLQAVRPITKGALKVLFGAGGDRDRTKRPRMGKAAAERSDFLYVTSDNPRSEEPEAIIADIVEVIPAGTAFEVIPDRKQAIAAALDGCGAGDALVIAGKGHENYQEIKGIKHPFSDIEEIQHFIQGKIQ